MTALNKQIDGSHYQKYKYQPVQYIMDLGMNFALGNAVKYLTRIGVDKDKGNIGIDKAIHYVEIFRDYWIDLDIYYPIRYLAPDILQTRIKEFTAQFSEPVAKAIELISLLNDGSEFLGMWETISPQHLERACDSVISHLQTLKD